MPLYTHPSTTYPALPWIDTTPIDPAIIQISTEWAFTLSDGTEVHVHGTGFTWDGDGEPLGGTVDSITRTTAGGGTVIEQVTGNGGGSLGLAFSALNTPDPGFGPVFNVVLSGADTLTGNTGTDYLYGGAGADAMDGGGGNDFADYSAATAAVQAFLGAAASNTGDAAGDTYTNIEGLRGSAFADTLAGNGSANTLLGGSGNDNLRGLAGNDTIDGGTGFDEVRYDRDAAAGGVAGVTVNLATGTATDGFGNTDTLLNIDQIRGTNQADSLTGGNTANNSFEGYRGLGGNDTITGGSGYDEVRYDQDAANGGAAGVIVNLSTQTATDGFGNTDTLSGIEGARGTLQADTFIGGTGNDNFYGLAGNDSFTGGDGFDFIGYQNDASFAGNLGVTVNLATGTATDGFGNTDTLSGIEGVGGTSQADTFVGRDFLGFYSDGFQGFAGNDTLTGGIGYDEARYDNDVDFGGFLGVTVDIAAGTATDGFGNTDTLISMDGARGTNFVDFLTGGSLLNTFLGLGGNDVIDGAGGSDEVRYDFDAENGGTAGVTVDLASGTAIDGFGDTDTLISIERAGGTAQVDSFTGNAGDNGFTGLAGNDILDGGAGNDEARYDRDFSRGGGAGVTVSLATGTAIDGFGNTDSLTSIEAVRGTRFNDSFTGSGANETFRGLAGNDAIDGGGGFDWVAYDRDVFNREESQTLAGVVVDLSAGTATDSYGGTDTLSSIENVAGAALDDTLTGSGGDNVFRGLAGNDTIDGQTGIDTVDYSQDRAFGDLVFLNGAAGVIVNLGTGTATDGFGNTDTLASIENAIGTEFADTFTGTSGANNFNGGAGNDTVVFSGNRSQYTITHEGQTVTVVGPDGTDTLTSIELLQFADGTAPVASVEFDDGIDRTQIDAGSAADQDNTLTGSTAAEFVVAGGGNDTVDAGGGSDVISLGDGNDTAHGGSGDDVIQADDGDDDVFGDDGDDLLIAGTGRGNDRYNGGTGIDTIAYKSTLLGIVLSLLAGTATGSEIDSDQLISIENASGGAGNDQITGSTDDNKLGGGAGNDALNGGAGNDTLEGNEGADQLLGGDGNDMLIIDSLDTVVDGGAGVDTVTLTGDGMVFNLAFSNIEIAIGTEGNDQIDGSVGTSGPLTLNGLGGVDILSGGASGDTINGGDGSDSLYGNAGADTISGGAGIDYIEGGADGDSIHGDGDNDTIYGQGGNDQIFGDGGNEYAFGGTGDDNMQGGTGTDYLVGDDNVIANTSITGTDTMLGGDDNDTLIGGYGGDNLTGENGSDALYGDFDDVDDGLTGTDPGSADTLTGGAGNDFMFGGGGNDTLVGGDDNDTLIGGGGNDTLTGGAGSDSLYGQAGTDTFVFGDGWGTDGIWDFADGSEIIDLSQVSGLTSFGQLSITDQVSGSLNYADVSFAGNHIFVVGVSAAQLTAADFII